ncbi:MAG: DUF5343 domain-containing protein [Dehalococcoidia bacterium]|nr:DUF5343 domain-containing protein [Dehalococcoidia bacterium]MDW8008811.1 DUF5343 domain-containing protein [Chloroflexota bacterium]
MPWQRSRLAPYGSLSAFLRLLREAPKHGWPQRVDAALLREMGFRGGSAWEVLVALRFLGLVDPFTDTPTERYSLLLQPWPEGRQGLAKAIHNAYTKALGDEGWAGRSEEELEGLFGERYGKALARRQARFALGLARVVGLRVAEPPRRRRAAALELAWLSSGMAGVGGDRTAQGAATPVVGLAEEGDPLRRRYVEVLLRRLERADPREAAALEQRIESILAGRPARRGVLAALGALLRPFRRERHR